MLRDSILLSLWKSWIICITQASATETYRQHKSCLTLNLIWKLLVLDFLSISKAQTARDNWPPSWAPPPTWPQKSTLVNLTLVNPWIYSPQRLFYFGCFRCGLRSITLILTTVITVVWQPTNPTNFGRFTTLLSEANRFTQMSSRTCLPKWLCLIQQTALT